MMTEEHGGSSRGRKSLFCNYLSKGWTRKEMSIDTKSRKYFVKDKDICMVLKCLPIDCLLVIRI